jgi:hypothetical protein
MGKIRAPIPVKLFVGMLSAEPVLFDACADILSRTYGTIDHHSDVLPWSDTDYYRQELGNSIVRKFIFFEHLIDAAALPKIKIFTNNVEKDFSTRTRDSMRRRINLDPGYITEAKVVLATTKDFSHRIYIGEGIYAEVTLSYNSRDRTFAPLEHTYPDFRTDARRTLFNTARDVLRTALNRTK